MIGDKFNFFLLTPIDDGHITFGDNVKGKIKIKEEKIKILILILRMFC